MSFLTDKCIMVTGGSGFVGQHVLRELDKQNHQKVFAPRSQEYDLREKDQVIRFFEKVRPDLVIHLAAVVGGIGANRRHPGRFFYDNAVMGINMIECARRFRVEKFICVGTICSYPKFTPVPFKEEDLWNGYPEETNAAYGLAKKMHLVQLEAYRQEYGFNGIYLMPVNVYGPHDNFDLDSGHVIPAVIRKCVEAKHRRIPRLVVWGTGQASREFLFVGDVAEAIVLAADKYNEGAPMNLGSGQEITIRDLVELIRAEVGYSGEVEWDQSKPDGQPRRCLDTSRARETLGWQAKIPLREGLRRTIDWYVQTTT
jgi:GDP-L-fucose synthase